MEVDEVEELVAEVEVEDVNVVVMIDTVVVVPPKNALLDALTLIASTFAKLVGPRQFITA